MFVAQGLFGSWFAWFGVLALGSRHWCLVGNASI